MTYGKGYLFEPFKFWFKHMAPPYFGTVNLTKVWDLIIWLPSKVQYQ